MRPSSQLPLIFAQTGAISWKGRVITMELEQIIQLMDKLEHSSLAELEYCIGDERLTLKKAKPHCPPPMPPAGPSGPAPVGIPFSPAPAAAPAPAAPTGAGPAPETVGVLVKAPLVGTFYRAPSPDAPPFVQPGDRVKKGQTLCLIEAMKMMNEITSPTDGVVEEILVENGEIVAFDAPLVRIKD